MCLREIKERYKIKDNKCGYGYKIVLFRKYDKAISPQFRGNGEQFKKGEWLHEKLFRSFGYRKEESIKVTGWRNKNKYPFGFHILLSTRKKLEQYLEVKRYSYCRLIRVKYRHAHTMGIDQTHSEFRGIGQPHSDFITIVAKEMFIIPDKKVKGGE